MNRHSWTEPTGRTEGMNRVLIDGRDPVHPYEVLLASGDEGRRIIAQDLTRRTGGAINLNLRTGHEFGGPPLCSDITPIDWPTSRDITEWDELTLLGLAVACGDEDDVKWVLEKQGASRSIGGWHAVRVALLGGKIELARTHLLQPNELRGHIREGAQFLGHHLLTMHAAEPVPQVEESIALLLDHGLKADRSVAVAEDVQRTLIEHARALDLERLLPAGVGV